MHICNYRIMNKIFDNLNIKLLNSKRTRQTLNTYKQQLLNTLLSAWYLIAADVNSRCTADILLLLLCINIPYTVAMVAILDVSEILSPNAALRISYRNSQFDIISWTASVKRQGLVRSWGVFWLKTLTPGIFIFCRKFFTWRT